MRKTPGQSDYGSNFTTCVGIVKNNADPAQHGRLQIYIPSIDTKDYDLEDLPWATYITPFGGHTVNYKAGRDQSTIPGVSTYGFWAVPKINAQVLCGFIEGEPNTRFWMGCIYQPELNRTLPSNIDPLLTEIDESGLFPQQEISHIKKNLNEAGLSPSDFHYKTRGGYERSISHPSNKNRNKPTDNGYYPKPNQPEKSDSQTICLTSPGRHYFVMSDVDEYCRVRLKTCEGHQIIFDDTNERIYISTAKGRNWIELDETNSKIYVYSDSKINIRAKNDINMFSDENINIVAKKRVNIESLERAVVIQAKNDVRFLSTHADILATASRDIHLKTTDGPRCSGAAEENKKGTVAKHWIHNWAEKPGSKTSSIKINAAKDVEIRADETFMATSKDSANLRSMTSSLNLQAADDLNLKANNIEHTTKTGNTGLNAVDPDGSTDPVTTTNEAGSARPAGKIHAVQRDHIVRHMILPDHESWERDEDEKKFKTPRNPKYQG